MSQTLSRTIPLAEATDAASVGGKAANLGVLIRAGFAVPDGFVIGLNEPTDDRESILAAYAAMGGGTVAARSSATAEDGAVASMAGQFETVLNVTGEDALLVAVEHCRASGASDRVTAYAAEHSIDHADIRMAVVVQRQVNADVAGVLFTAAPGEPFPRQILIEASWGLGESVVSGKVRPDAVRVAFDDGSVISTVVSEKKTEWTIDGEQEIDADRRMQCCLTTDQIRRLWELGRQVETHFGRPQDIEWAIAGDKVYLLQSRPITTAGDPDALAAAVHATRAQLADALSKGRGPWVLHNLVETLPHPTPLTWSVVRRFMSATGGYGRAYAAIGFKPTGEFLDRIAGRIYMDASRAPAMFAADFPFAYDAELLRREPDASQLPPTMPRGSMLARLRAGRMLGRAARALAALPATQSFDDITEYVRVQKTINLDALSNKELIQTWYRHEVVVTVDAARREVLSGLRAGHALDHLREFIAEHMWDEDAAAIARLLSSGGAPDASITADAMLYAVGKGAASLESWLDIHGHRGVGEFDLASPRWRETPDTAREAAARLASGESPTERHHRHANAVQRKAHTIRATLSVIDAKQFDERVSLASQAVPGREAAKDRLMLGYDLMRDVARAIGRRIGVGDDIFYLSWEEMIEALHSGTLPAEQIRTARAAHSAEARLQPPRFIDATAAAYFGERRAIDTESAAMAISGGVATGPALVVHSPSEVGQVPRGYVLVCPSTDPSWTPAFTGASALVIECGGALSHGAVVAREMGLPAVVLADATRRFKTGNVLRVDGDAGHAALADDPSAIDPLPTKNDVQIAPPLIPPPAGRKDRTAATWRNRAAAIWAIFLLAFFFLPASLVRWPTFAIFDSILWPLVRIAGWPITVAILAAFTAAFTLMLQRTVTDNRRLLEAKRRAAILRKQAVEWPIDSPRRAEMLRAATSVPARVLGASLVPAGLLLGPMVAGFIWLGVRAEPAAWNAAAGASVRVVVMTDGESTQPVTLVVPESVSIDSTTPATQSLPPIRETLQHLSDDLSQSPTKSAQLLPPNTTADDLRAYLRSPIPAQGLTWVLRAVSDFDGTFAVQARSGQSVLDVGVTVGNSRSPRPSFIAGSKASPLRSIEVIYPRPAQERHCFRIAGVDVGWVGVYVGVYVLALAIVRRVARVA